MFNNEEGAQLRRCIGLNSCRHIHITRLLFILTQSTGEWIIYYTWNIAMLINVFPFSYYILSYRTLHLFNIIEIEFQRRQEADITSNFSYYAFLTFPQASRITNAKCHSLWVISTSLRSKLHRKKVTTSQRDHTLISASRGQSSHATRSLRYNLYPQAEKSQPLVHTLLECTSA